MLIELTRNFGTYSDKIWINPNSIVKMSKSTNGSEVLLNCGEHSFDESPQEIMDKCRPATKPSARIESLGNQVAALKSEIERHIKSNDEITAQYNAMKTMSSGLGCEVRKWAIVASEQEAEIQRLRQLVESLASAMSH